MPSYIRKCQHAEKISIIRMMIKIIVTDAIITEVYNPDWNGLAEIELGRCCAYTLSCSVLASHPLFVPVVGRRVCRVWSSPHTTDIYIIVHQIHSTFRPVRHSQGETTNIIPCDIFRFQKLNPIKHEQCFKTQTKSKKMQRVCSLLSQQTISSGNNAG